MEKEYKALSKAYELRKQLIRKEAGFTQEELAEKKILVITDLGDENDTRPEMLKLKDYVTSCHDI